MPSSATLTDSTRSPDETRGVLLSLGAALVWPLQAAIIAWVIGGLLTDPGRIAPVPAALGFLALAALRSGIGMAAQRALADAAEARIAGLRAAILDGEARVATDS